MRDHIPAPLRLIKFFANCEFFWIYMVCSISQSFFVFRVVFSGLIYFRLVLVRVVYKIRPLISVINFCNFLFFFLINFYYQSPFTNYLCTHNYTYKSQRCQLSIFCAGTGLYTIGASLQLFIHVWVCLFRTYFCFLIAKYVYQTESFLLSQLILFNSQSYYFIFVVFQIFFLRSVISICIIITIKCDYFANCAFVG